VNSKNIVVVGAGFAGLSAAGFLAKAGHHVTILEKNSWVGGRAQVLERDGFRFDMGPSWYLMPAEHDKWFAQMGHAREDFYTLKRLTPNYRVFFNKTDNFDVSSDISEVKNLFERYETGSAHKLDKYLAECAFRYDFAMKNFIYRNYGSALDMMTEKVVFAAVKLGLFSSYQSIVRRYFRHPFLRAILEYPVVFLGSRASATPGVYTLMSHVDLTMGVYYPAGGFSRVVESMAEVVREKGVKILLNTAVVGLNIHGGAIHSVRYHENGEPGQIECDIVVNAADYHWFESELLEEKLRTISAREWTRKKLAPSALCFYIGVDTKLIGLEHHTFFFDADWDAHFEAVYGDKKHWAKKPLFYAHVPSRTDIHVAPEGKEALFILVPCAPGIEDTPEIRAEFFNQTIDRMEELTGQDIRKHILFRESYCIKDFERDYNSFLGNAFGLGHTLLQTGPLRPPNRSSKIPNLYFCGQYSIPGTGTSMSMIGGQVTAERILAELE
jgi:phytoene desaturase